MEALRDVKNTLVALKVNRATCGHGLVPLFKEHRNHLAPQFKLSLPSTAQGKIEAGHMLSEEEGKVLLEAQQELSLLLQATAQLQSLLPAAGMATAAAGGSAIVGATVDQQTVRSIALIQYEMPSSCALQPAATSPSCPCASRGRAAP
jgi:hypothetical protein